MLFHRCVLHLHKQLLKESNTWHKHASRNIEMVVPCLLLCPVSRGNFLPCHQVCFALDSTMPHAPECGCLSVMYQEWVEDGVI